MAALSSISELQLFKRRDSGREEFEALLDMLPQPTLIADEGSGQILFANAQAIQLTAYTREELSELELSTLLPKLDSRKLKELINSEDSAHTHTLIARSSQSLQVKLSFNSLGGSDHLLTIRLEAVKELQKKQVKHEQDRERWEAVHLLSKAGQQNELASSFRQILLAGKKLTGADHLALYTQGNEDGVHSLQAVAGSGLDFPPEISASDLAKVNTATIWQAGKSIQSPLHKLAQSSKLNYLATAPLDLARASSGLIVAADESNPPAEDLPAMLQILAASAATAALNTQLVENISDRLDHLAHSEHLNQALQENVQDGLLLISKGLLVEEINPAAIEMLGYSSAEAQGLSATDILVSSQPLSKAFEVVLRKGEKVDLGEVRLHRRNGSEFSARLLLSPLIEDERVINIAVIVNDLSENEALHLRSKQLQQRAWLGEVTAIFAHEVRNPINNISTGLQLMQINLEEQDPLQEQIRRLQEDCDRLDHRMKSVLSFSRTLEHKPESIDIGEFCRMQLERWGARMARKNIEHHLQVEAETPPVMGDRLALDQVFTNLITNAIDAMQNQDSGVIAIKIKSSAKSKTSGFVEIHLSDSGPGIPKDLRNRVFDPFFTTKENEGTGLGLAITKRIIMAHKGEISIDSFPGGTLFKIRLPIAAT